MFDFRPVGLQNAGSPSAAETIHQRRYMSVSDQCDKTGASVTYSIIFDKNGYQCMQTIYTGRGASRCLPSDECAADAIVSY